MGSTMNYININMITLFISLNLSSLDNSFIDLNNNIIDIIEEG